MSHQKYIFRVLVLSALTILIIGCNRQIRNSDESVDSLEASFHHVHLNVTNIDSTMDYYEKFFGATRVKYRNQVEALFTEKSFLLLDIVDKAPPTHLGSSLWHIGWSGVDGQSEFEWRVREGIDVHTPITPLGKNFWMYFYGPEKEIIEVWTGNKNHRFEHIHLVSSDVDKTMAWFETHFGLASVREKSTYFRNNSSTFKWNLLRLYNINIIVFGQPGQERYWWPEEFKVTDGSAIDHIAFSFERIDNVFAQIKSAGVEIIHDISTNRISGIRSFFVRGPDGLLVEIVEEKPIPEGIWK